MIGTSRNAPRDGARDTVKASRTAADDADNVESKRKTTESNEPYERKRKEKNKDL